MTEHETLSFNSLNLSWPHCINYHVDSATADASNPNFGNETEVRGTRGQEPVETYNGVRREYIRNAEPLFGNEIRVLDLRNGTPGMPLVGSLRKVCLSDRLSNRDVYEPLSYTWEDCDTVQQHRIDNTEDNAHPRLFLFDTVSLSSLKLTLNCAEALRRVRKSRTERTIWVDSICVNQDDPEERSRQVDLMKEIYARAFTVLVYLGRESREDDSSSNNAMLLLRQPDRLHDFVRLDQHERTSLQRLFGRRYFRRMWIVQEVALAETLEFYCGPDITHVSEFAGKPLKAILGTRVTPPWLRHSKQANTEIRSAYATSQAQQILSLIFDTAFCDCKDDRDRIFAIFSLLNSSGKEQLKADYSLSTAQVYTGIAAYLAKNGFMWVVLMLAPYLALDKSRGLPSWVPDWSKVGEVGIEPGPDLFDRIVSKSHDPDLDTGFEISNSGVITIRGMLLGSVTNSDDTRKVHFGPSDDFFPRVMNELDFPAVFQNASLVAELLNRTWERDLSVRVYGNGSLWTLARPTHMQDKSLESWEWHFEFSTRCKQLIDAAHVALMLPDYSTVLILRPDDRIHGSYALVDIGMPLVWTSRPGSRRISFDDPQLIPLDSLKKTPYQKKSHLDTIRSSEELFPRLSELPELWEYNPLTSTTTLTNKAILDIRSTDMSELSMVEIWRKHARKGVQVLSHETRLRLLIDEVDSLCREDYRQIEEVAVAALETNANLSASTRWPLDHFLGLFIRGPLGTMVLPDVQLHDDESLDGIPALQQLMQWAEVFSHLVFHMQSESEEHWPYLPKDWHLRSDAWIVSSYQVSTTCDASHILDRTSALLRKILRQLSDESSPHVEQVQGSRFYSECYWDWRRFNSVLERRFSVLSHIEPDVRKIKADFDGFAPDFRAIAAHQVLAAHGLDPSKKEFTEIRIR